MKDQHKQILLLPGVTENKAEIKSENEVYLYNLQTWAFPSPISIDNGVVYVVIKKLKIVSHKSPWLVSGFPGLGHTNASSSQASCHFPSQLPPSSPNLWAQAESTPTLPVLPVSQEHSGLSWNASSVPAHFVTGSISHLTSPNEPLGTLNKDSCPSTRFQMSLEDLIFSIINETTYHFKCIFVDLRSHQEGEIKNKKPAPHVLKPWTG